KDENDASDIVGEWNLTNIHSENGYSILFGDTSNYEFHGTAYNIETTFTENPNQFSSTGDYTFEVTTSTFGIPLTQTQTVSAFPGTGTWSINGDTLTQVFSGATTEIKILELNNSKMRLKEHLDTDVTGIHTVADIYSTFEKN
ncbi:MAG TPA: lipocalin family protein, partial [Saprospiraceae bacterium]|nr:lipocalin family protein [Saprospiraceae bacterium]